MKFKFIVAGIFSTMLLTACQSTLTERLTPTADKETVEEARHALAAYEEFDIDDDGTITLVQTLPEGYHWLPHITKKIGLEVSCDNLRYFVDKGMVVAIHYKGARGRFDQYDSNRCIELEQDL
ncbi:hypothetical protein [Vibrio sp. HN007]|uniref:hypothetical protein n=1 Tax=Vibrio iocasae TaxID=3098914 RepID=UPI0035D40BAC